MPSEEYRIERNLIASHRSLKAKLVADQNYQCGVCKIDITNTAEVDHKIPLSRGGSGLFDGCIDNLWALCSTCNRQKGSKTVKEYLEWLDTATTEEMLDAKYGMMREETNPVQYSAQEQYFRQLNAERRKEQEGMRKYVEAKNAANKWLEIEMGLFDFVIEAE